MNDKVIKVKLKFYENDEFIELWEVIKKGKPQYIGRYTYGIPYWIYVSDPLGYCENSHPLEDDIKVIVCDDNNKELFATSNVECLNSYKKFKKYYS